MKFKKFALRGLIILAVAVAQPERNVLAQRRGVVVAVDVIVRGGSGRGLCEVPDLFRGQTGDKDGETGGIPEEKSPER